MAIGNRVTVLIRPIYSTMMWQCWSDDAGASWDAACRTTFPGYAQSMIRTRSGAILCGHRYPQYTVHISRDDGLNWDQGTIIDYPAWAMGCMVEVEPDVVLCTYMNAQQNLPLLAQLVRVTATGIQPVPREGNALGAAGDLPSIGESYGNVEGRRVYSALYSELTSNHHLAPKACLLPQSRGGLMLYNWAATPGD
ncbi:MAG: hypothetical protein A2W31_09085 [Planctomycetes bacterium RBG_16_64_10]|nr:MAG: hypothetical protein A2W31_09085 [Planctomycetes bacterium RBG_16_64_10]